MASEELDQRYPQSVGQASGDYEVFECQLVTLNQFGEHGILPQKDYGVYKSQKCDTLVISRTPSVHAVAIGERKAPGGINWNKWQGLAAEVLEKKCRPTGALVGFVTDGVATRWFNGGADKVIEIVREDGSPLPHVIDFGDDTFIAAFTDLVQNFEPATSTVRATKRSDPEALSKEVWQTLWRLKADRPEDCLATFVEIFIYKFLDDLGLIKTNKSGINVGVAALLAVEKTKSYKFYEQHVRPYIKDLFPHGSDGYSVINGTILQGANRDHNIIFHEILRKFVRFGSLKNTAPEFKTRLYESFLKESKTTTTFGQFFTPRKVVGAIHDMAGVEKLPAGRTICDPAAGVGGFVLEQLARDLTSQFSLTGNKISSVHTWSAFEIVPKTAILAKANALVHCGDLLADQPKRVAAFAKWLNRTFVCMDKTSLGALELRSVEAYDLIMTNPPFVVSGSADISKLVQSDNQRRRYFSRKASGVEGLFIQYIVQSLKKNGDAWVLLPESFFLRTTDTALREWIFSDVHDFIARHSSRADVLQHAETSCDLSSKKATKGIFAEAVGRATRTGEGVALCGIGNWGDAGREAIARAL